MSSDATVVDQLIVKLGLDPSGFTKGQKEVAAQLVNVENQAKKSGDSIASSVLSAVGKIAGITSVAAVALKAVGYMSNLSTTIRQLGINADNLGLAAPKLKNFQNAAEVFGGTAEGITKTINGFQKAIFDLGFNGEISQSLVMLGRLGVQFQTADGHARDFNDVMLDTATALQKAQQNGTMTRAEATQYAQEAGFGDAGSLNLVLAGPDAIRAEQARQAARHQINGTELASATDLEQSATNRDQRVAAAAVQQLPKFSAVGVAANQKAGDLAETLLDPDAFEKLGEAVANGIEAMTNAAKDFIGTVKDFAGGGFANGRHYNRSDFTTAIGAAAKKYGIDPDVLSGIIGTESAFNPNATSRDKSGTVVGQGIAQLNPRYHPNAGKDPLADIDEAARVIAANRDHFLKDGNDADAALYLGLQAYNGGESRVRTALGGGRPLSQETVDYPRKVLASARASRTAGTFADADATGGNTTTVTVGQVTVNTQATDAAGMAAGADAALQRKLFAGQSEQGMQ